MSRSNKARYGVNCRTWKDTMLASKSQKKAYTKKKRRRARKERRAARVDPLVKAARQSGKVVREKERPIDVRTLLDPDWNRGFSMDD